MADFNDTSHKGMVLMQQALKKYVEGDFEGGDKDREDANRFFDLASLEINSEEGKLSQLYGESRNFGIIYNVFEQNIDKLMESNKGKKILKEGFNLIKKNKILNEQFKIYDLFEKSHGIENPKEFVNEAVGLVNNFDKKQIKETNDKFIGFMRKNKLDEYVEIPEEVENLYESIEYIILNKKSFDNVNEFIKAQNVITEQIEKNNKEDEDDPEPKKTDPLYKKDYNLWSQKWMGWSARHPSKENKSFDKFKEEVEDEEKKVDESINDDERKLIETFTDANKNKKQIFEKYKNDTLSLIKEAIETSSEDDKLGWQNHYDRISKKNYSDNLSENITNCAEMLEICSIIKG